MTELFEKELQQAKGTIAFFKGSPSWTDTLGVNVNACLLEHLLNTRAPIPATPDRMADVRLGAEHIRRVVCQVLYIEGVKFSDIEGHADQIFKDYPWMLKVATVTLPDAKGCEADRGIDWYAAYERMAHNRNELWAKLEAVKAALAAEGE